MTDQLPRQIPSDPAEQERLMPEWVKVEVCRRTGHELCAVIQAMPGLFAHALTIWQWMPELVDPDLLIAREVCAELWPDLADDYLHNAFDDDNFMKVALAAIKRVRALERGEG